MNDWKTVPEVVGRNAELQRAVALATRAIEQRESCLLIGEAGTGKRLIARNAWAMRQPSSGSLFTLDCRIVSDADATTLLFGERCDNGPRTTIKLGKLNLNDGGALLLLHAERLSSNLQERLAKLLEQTGDSRGSGCPVILTTDSSADGRDSLHPLLRAVLLPIHVPPLRERLEDVHRLCEAFLHQASPFRQIRCSQALLEMLREYDWPGNVTELRSLTRRLLLEANGPIIDISDLAAIMFRGDASFSSLAATARLSTSVMGPRIIPTIVGGEGWNLV